MRTKTDVIAEALWNAHVARQGNLEAWAPWAEAVKNRVSIARECQEDAAKVVEALVAQAQETE